MIMQQPIALQGWQQNHNQNSMGYTNFQILQTALIYLIFIYFGYFAFSIYRFIILISTLFILMESEKIQTPVEVPPQEKEEKKTHKKGQKKDQKRQKKEHKSQYQYNAEIITIDTQIPPLPKKTDLLKKPEFDQVKQREKKNKQKLQKLFDQKKQLKAENYKPNRKQKGQQNKHGAFKSQIGEVKQLRERFAVVKKFRNQKRDLLHQLIQKAKANNNVLKELGGSTKGSRQNIIEHLAELQHRLTTDSLTKEGEKSLNNQITALKRKIKDAEQVGSIQIKLAKAQQLRESLNDQIQKVKADKEPYEKQYTQIKNELDKKNLNIDGLKKDIETIAEERKLQKQKHNQEWQKWKQNKKKRLDQIQARIKKIHQENDKMWLDFNVQKDNYWKQKHYVDFIQWQMKVKTRKINDIERDKKRKMYEQKDKERQKEEQLQKYIGQIELCNFLINYMINIREDFNKGKQAANQKKTQIVDINAKLAQDSQWKKQKGVQILKSKKSKQDEEVPKKGKKFKKKKQDEKQQQQKVFNIPFNVQSMFESLNVLAPSSLQQIDKKIDQLRDREKLFQRVCQQQPDENDVKLIQQIKTKKSIRKVDKPLANKNQEDDFPTI